MSKADLEKLRSIGYTGPMRGKSRVSRLRSDKDGRTTGFEIDHGDSQEAIVRPKYIEVTTSINSGEVKVDGQTQTR